ncbi:MAG: TPM domain-containing protein [Nitritalea sp.]
MRAHKNFFLTLSLVMLSFWALAQKDFPSKPYPPRLVNDFTQTLKPAEIQQLERKLVAYNDSTSTQVSIVLLRSVGDYDIGDYAFQLGDRWGIGRSDLDNGVLILAAIQDRKVFIATGYGMEGALPDALIKRMIEQLIIPNFRMEAYYTGLDRTTDLIFSLAAGEFSPKEALGAPSQPEVLRGFIVFLFFVLFFLVPLLRNKRDRRNHIGGRGADVDLMSTIMLANILKGGSKGKYGQFSSGRGSFGGGFGGGFGGFGGGSFGGGGAGGSW